MRAAYRGFARSVLPVCVLVACGIVILAVLPSPASAYAPPQEVIESPTNWEALKTVLTDPLPATASEPAKTVLWRTRVLAGVLPAIGDVTLAGGALILGYELGGEMNEWFDISNTILGVNTYNPATCTSGSGFSKDRFALYPTDPTGWFPLVTFPAYVPVIDVDCNGGTSANQSLVAEGDTPYGLAMSNFYTALASAVGGTRQIRTVGSVVFHIVTVPVATINAGMVVTASGTGAYDGSDPSPTTLSAPTEFDPADLPDEIDDPGADDIIATLESGDDATDVEIAKILDPEYEGPAYEMPACYGMTVGACEDAINAAASEVHLGETVEFTIETAEAADEDVAESLVVASDPVATTVGHHVAVTLIKNPADEGNGAGCTTQTHNPHWSILAGSVVAKADVKCNYTGTAAVTMNLWKCTSSPDPNEVALALGSWGCALAATTFKEIPVVAGTLYENVIYVPDLGSTLVSGNAYFIASTSIPSATTTWSQETPTRWVDDGS